MEIAALASAGVAALTAERDRAGLNGALRLFSASAAAGAIVLFSLAALLQSIGVLDLAALPFALIEAPVLASLGAGLFIIGVAARAGVAPMHAWLAAAAGRGGAASAMLLAVVGAFGGLSVIVRVSSYFIQAPALGEAVGAVLAGLGVAGVAAGSLQAIGATSLRRLGVYAGVAQGGCVLLAAALGSAAGHAAALVMLASFAGAALALFAGAAAMRGPGPFAMDALDGFGRRAPLAGAALAAAALSFMGAPLTLGFLGRWRLMEASVGAEWGWAAAAGIAASLAGVFFGGRLIERLYFRKFAAPAQSEEAWAFALTPALLVGAAAVISGVAPAWLLRLASLAAANLGAGP